jgi:hypothetical protein
MNILYHHLTTLQQSDSRQNKESLGFVTKGDSRMHKMDTSGFLPHSTVNNFSSPLYKIEHMCYYDQGFFYPHEELYFYAP